MQTKSRPLWTKRERQVYGTFLHALRWWRGNDVVVACRDVINVEIATNACALVALAAAVGLLTGTKLLKPRKELVDDVWLNSGDGEEYLLKHLFHMPPRLCRRVIRACDGNVAEGREGRAVARVRTDILTALGVVEDN